MGRRLPFSLFAFFFAFATFATGLMGCRQLVGIEHREVATDGGEAGSSANACGSLPTPVLPTCQTCSEQKCCSPSAACSKDAVCDDEYTCLGACRPDNSSAVAVESCRSLCASAPNA